MQFVLILSRIEQILPELRAVFLTPFEWAPFSKRKFTISSWSEKKKIRKALVKSLNFDQRCLKVQKMIWTYHLLPQYGELLNHRYLWHLNWHLFLWIARVSFYILEEQFINRYSISINYSALTIQHLKWRKNW